MQFHIYKYCCECYITISFSPLEIVHCKEQIILCFDFKRFLKFVKMIEMVKCDVNIKINIDMRVKKKSLK